MKNLRNIALTLVLALTLALTMAAPVFAADPTDGGGAGDSDVTIDVTDSGDLVIKKPDDEVDPEDEDDDTTYDDLLGIDVSTAALDFGSQKASILDKTYKATDSFGFIAENSYAIGWGFKAQLSPFALTNDAPTMAGCQISFTKEETDIFPSGAGTANDIVKDFTLIAGGEKVSAIDSMPMCVIGANWDAALKVFGGTAVPGTPKPAKITWYFVAAI